MGVLGPMGPAGFRRRGRRRGLIVGAAVGAAAARHGNKQQQEGQVQPSAQDPDVPDYEAELTQLQSLKDKNLITEDEYEAKKKQILGI